MITTEKFCPHCGNRYKLTIYKTKFNNHTESKQICPYCGETVRTSTEYEYYTEK